MVDKKVREEYLSSYGETDKINKGAKKVLGKEYSEYQGTPVIIARLRKKKEKIEQLIEDYRLLYIKANVKWKE